MKTYGNIIYNQYCPPVVKQIVLIHFNTFEFQNGHQNTLQLVNFTLNNDT